MRLIVPIFVVFLVQLAAAVFVEDAFVRDWTRHWVGQVSAYQFYTTNSIIGVSDQNQLFKIDVSDGAGDHDIIWRVSLGDAALKLLVNAALHKMYTYSVNSNEVKVWDSELGLFEGSYTLKAEPVGLVNFFNRGVLLVALDGSIELLPADASAQPQLTVHQLHGVSLTSESEVHSSVHDGTIYIAMGNKIVALDGSGGVAKEYSFAASKIAEFKENLIVTTEGALHKIERDSVIAIKTSGSQDKHVIVNSEYVASTSAANGGYKVLKINHDKHTLEQVVGLPESENAAIKSVVYAGASINDFLMLSTDSESFVVDITGLLSDDIADSAESSRLEHPFDSNGVLKLAYDANDKLVLSSAQRGSKGDIIVTRVVDPKSPFLTTVTVKNSLYHKSLSEKYLLVDKPSVDVSVLDHAQVILNEEQTSNFLFAWYMRIQRHSIELIEFVLSYGKSDADSSATSTVFGLEKLIVFYDESKSSLVAIESSNGQLFWESLLSGEGELVDIVFHDDHVYVIFQYSVSIINIRNGEIFNSYAAKDIEKVALVKETNAEEEVVAHVLGISASNIGYVFGTSGVTELTLSNDKYFIDKISGSGYKLSKDLHLFPTWKLPFTTDENVIKVEAIASEVTPSGDSMGIVLSDKSVLYKYLNPNIASIVTYVEKLDRVTVYVVDIVSGNILFEQSHVGELIDVKSIKITMDSNWAIYSYFSIKPRAEQRVVVIDLFETGVPNEKSSPSNVTIGHVSTKSFIYPERIVEIGQTFTKFGITSKAILFVTDSGSLVQVPKFILNSRRIADREFTQKDFQDDFRFSPYEPVIEGLDGEGNFYSVLNHRKQFTTSKSENSGKIISVGTELESTSVVCYINSIDWFCTSVQPSLPYDTLGATFAKTKLLITIGALVLGVLITNPMVTSKRLNGLWLDRP